MIAFDDIELLIDAETHHSRARLSHQFVLRIAHEVTRTGEVARARKVDDEEAVAFDGNIGGNAGRADGTVVDVALRSRDGHAEADLSGVGAAGVRAWRGAEREIAAKSRGELHPVGLERSRVHIRDVVTDDIETA